jgi:hypothetical protein
LVPQPGNSTIAANGAANRQDWTGKTLTGLPFRRAFVTRNSLGAFTHSDLELLDMAAIVAERAAPRSSQLHTSLVFAAQPGLLQNCQQGQAGLACSAAQRHARPAIQAM